MSGMFGGGSAKTDRGNQLAATQGEWNIFNTGLPTGNAQQATGTNTLSTATSTLQPAQQYYQNLLSAGRTETAQNAAPAINSTLAQSDAARVQQGQFGTSRQGGTAAGNQQQQTNTESSIDNIINNTLQTGKATGAAGLEKIASEQASIGSTELASALSNLGLSQTAINSILQNSTASRGQSFDIQQQEGSAIGSLLLGEFS